MQTIRSLTVLDTFPPQAGECFLAEDGLILVVHSLLRVQPVVGGDGNAEEGERGACADARHDHQQFRVTKTHRITRMMVGSRVSGDAQWRRRPGDGRRYARLTGRPSWSTIQRGWRVFRPFRQTPDPDVER